MPASLLSHLRLQAGMTSDPLCCMATRASSSSIVRLLLRSFIIVVRHHDSESSVRYLIEIEMLNLSHNVAGYKTGDLLASRFASEAGKHAGSLQSRTGIRWKQRIVPAHSVGSFATLLVAHRKVDRLKSELLYLSYVLICISLMW